MSGPRHFLDLDRIEADELRRIVDMGDAFRRGEAAGQGSRPLEGRTLAMIFEKPSTRTRVSFEVGIKQLGGEAVVLNPDDMQIGRGETIGDTARVLSRYVDAVMMRTNDPEKLEELAESATIPVINGLTDRSHPCQLIADVMTFEQHRGPIAGRTVAWSGDGNNMAVTWMHAAARFGFALRLASPPELSVPQRELDWARRAGADIAVCDSPAEAVAGADCVVTDTWVSMGGQPGERRHNLLVPYRVDAALMEKASRDAIFMHCLPAHRGEEVTRDVLDGPHSVVWDEAENRLHAQKGILVWCLG